MKRGGLLGLKGGDEVIGWYFFFSFKKTRDTRMQGLILAGACREGPLSLLLDR